MGLALAEVDRTTTAPAAITRPVTAKSKALGLNRFIGGDSGHVKDGCWPAGELGTQSPSDSQGDPLRIARHGAAGTSSALVQPPFGEGGRARWTRGGQPARSVGADRSAWLPTTRQRHRAGCGVWCPLRPQHSIRRSCVSTGSLLHAGARGLLYNRLGRPIDVGPGARTVLR